ncbi:MAG: hypothetical protein E7291_04765 [Lachnospiraceae bacterium]|nr:hypothetical protein [Lachnospiraceae bacterium]
MQEIIERILEGNFDYENGSLDFSCVKIEITMPQGSIYEGSFHITSSPGSLTEGHVYCSDIRMECTNPEFSGNDVEIYYCFHGEYMEEGDVVKGAFCVVSNQGEYYLPYVVSIEHTVLKSSIGNIKNLFHFANLAKSNWAEALHLFYSSEFTRVFAGNDGSYYDSYRALSAYPGNEQNMEEFLIQINKKQKVEFFAEESQINLDMHVADNPYAVTETELNIVRNGWGYTALHVECEGDFVFTEKEVLSDDEFLGNHCRLPIYIDTTMCRHGKNFGMIYIYNSYVSLEIPVIVRLGDNLVGRHSEWKRKRTIVQMMDLYQAFRMKKISTNTWLKETGKLIDGLVAIDEKDVEARLFQAQLLITEARYNEAGWLLDHSADLLEQQEEKDSALWAYYLYLTTLIHREEDYVNQIAAKVENIYRRNKESWRVAWLLLYLSEEYNKSAAAKWNFLEKQFYYGCSSPILYIEALNLVNSNPSLLRRLDGFEMQVLWYGAKQETVSAGVVEQLLYLTGRVKSYSNVLKNILIRLYEKKADTRVLQEICALLIKGGKSGRQYFTWYQKGVEAQLRITNLYEYYMMSIDMNPAQILPKMVLMYFSYQNNLDYEHCAFLYHYMWLHRNEYSDLYYNYRPKLERFVAEQVQREHINRYLSVLYQDILTPGIVTQQTAGPLSRLVFAHQIHVEDTRFQKVIVYQPGNLHPAEYSLQGGNAWVSLYGNEYTIAFEDAWGNRFVKNVEYVLEKLMMPSKYIKMLARYVKDSLELDIYLCTNEREDGDMSEEVKERYVRVVNSPYADNTLKRDICLKLLKFYYDGDDMRALDDYLEQISPDSLSMDDRSQVLRYMVLRGKCDAAFSWIGQYGPYFVDAKTLMRLINEMIRNYDYVEQPVLLAAAVYAFKKGKYDSTILKYLSKHYMGMSKDMRDIWKASNSFDVNCYELCERMLIQMLYSGAFVGEKMDILRYYVSQGAKQEVEEAVLAQCSYEYFVHEKLTEGYIFQEIYYAYQRGEAIQKVCKLAFLKYYAENPSQLTNELQALAWEFLEEMMRERIHLNFFREYKNMDLLIREMSDKTIIEYKAHPRGRARIHYVILHENGEAEEYRSEYMQEVYGGVCFKEFVLFFGESLQYYIMEELDGVEQLTESGNLQKSDIIGASVGSKYEMINDMVISKNLQDYDTLDELLEEYYRREFLNQQLFVLE